VQPDLQAPPRCRRPASRITGWFDPDLPDLPVSDLCAEAVNGDHLARDRDGQRVDRIAQAAVTTFLRAVVADVADTVGRATPSMLTVAVPVPVPGPGRRLLPPDPPGVKMSP